MGAARRRRSSHGMGLVKAAGGTCCVLCRSLGDVMSATFPLAPCHHIRRRGPSQSAPAVSLPPPSTSRLDIPSLPPPPTEALPRHQHPSPPRVHRYSRHPHGSQGRSSTNTPSPSLGRRTDPVCSDRTVVVYSPRELDHSFPGSLRTSPTQGTTLTSAEPSKSATAAWTAGRVLTSVRLSFWAWVHDV